MVWTVGALMHECLTRDPQTLHAEEHFLAAVVIVLRATHAREVNAAPQQREVGSRNRL
jgi:hypothetical protein